MTGKHSAFWEERRRGEYFSARVGVFASLYDTVLVPCWWQPTAYYPVPPGRERRGNIKHQIRVFSLCATQKKMRTMMTSSRHAPYRLGINISFVARFSSVRGQYWTPVLMRNYAKTRAWVLSARPPRFGQHCSRRSTSILMQSGYTDFWRSPHNNTYIMRLPVP